MAAITCELLWIKGISADLSIFHTQPVALHCDNHAAIHISKNPVFHDRTMNVQVDYHFIRDEILNGTIVTPGFSNIER